MGRLSYPGEHDFATSNSWERLPPRQVYLDGIWVGYRGFDRFRTGVRYPFGFGLGYTTFAVRNLKLDGESTHGWRIAKGRNRVLVGFTSVDLPLQADLILTAESASVRE